jgi:hypothetical protein
VLVCLVSAVLQGFVTLCCVAALGHPLLAANTTAVLFSQQQLAAVGCFHACASLQQHPDEMWQGCPVMLICDALLTMCHADGLESFYVWW